MGQTQKIGGEGERRAVEWLRSEGFEVVARNWRSGRYELDIVAVRGDVIHFVEVKTRGDEGWQSPEEAMTPGKVRAFRRAAAAWLAVHPTELEPQMDLVAVDATSGEVSYVPEAVLSRW